MRGNRLFAAIFLLMAALAQADFSQRKAGRNLTGYDNGGTVDAGFYASSTLDKASGTKLRSFIWDHWKKKHRGRITAIFRSIEGDPGMYRYFIEPDDRGVWRIVMKWQRTCCNLDLMNNRKAKLKRSSGVDVYHYVEWVEHKIPPYVPPPAKRTLFLPSNQILLLKKTSSAPYGWEI